MPFSVYRAANRLEDLLPNDAAGLYLGFQPVQFSVQTATELQASFRLLDGSQEDSGDQTFFSSTGKNNFYLLGNANILN